MSKPIPISKTSYVLPDTIQFHYKRYCPGDPKQRNITCGRRIPKNTNASKKIYREEDGKIWCPKCYKRYFPDEYKRVKAWITVKRVKEGTNNPD